MEKKEFEMIGVAAFQGAVSKIKFQSKANLVKALVTTALSIERDARQNVPVLTGNLKNSITNEVNKPNISAEVFTIVDYAPYVEFGTDKQSPQPYLMPAVNANIGFWFGSVERAIATAGKGV